MTSEEDIQPVDVAPPDAQGLRVVVVVAVGEDDHLEVVPKTANKFRCSVFQKEPSLISTPMPRRMI